jgi:hypothetical protein
MKIIGAFLFTAFNLFAQTNQLAAPDTTGVALETNRPLSIAQRSEAMRTLCIQERRLICGKILRILPDGLVVESGYTDLLRPAFSSSWLVPGTVSANRPANLIESREPGAVCVGTIFFSDIPKSRGKAPKPRPYDYIILMGYPAGQYVYTSVGTVQKNIRHFSGSLTKAVNLSLGADALSSPGFPSK